MSTTNPIMIMAINMTIVFFVLYVLSLCIRLVSFMDPSKKKSKKKKRTAPPKPKLVASAPADDYQSKLDIALITAGLIAYGCKDFTITKIKKLD